MPLPAFPRETEPTEGIGIVVHIEIGHEELAHMTVQTEKPHNLPSAGWRRPRGASPDPNRKVQE